MQFQQLHQITALEPGKSITAIRRLDANEEYLGDHFPKFPVMPGVLMLEALYQAAMWLVLKSEDYACTIVTLREARNVKYADFVVPGQLLTVNVVLLKQDDETTTVNAKATVRGADKEEAVAVSARLVLDRYRLAERFPERAATDAVLIREMKKRFDALWSPADAAELN